MRCADSSRSPDDVRLPLNLEASLGTVLVPEKTPSTTFGVLRRRSPLLSRFTCLKPEKAAPSRSMVCALIVRVLLPDAVVCVPPVSSTYEADSCALTDDDPALIAPAAICRRLATFQLSAPEIVSEA